MADPELRDRPPRDRSPHDRPPHDRPPHDRPWRDHPSAQLAVRLIVGVVCLLLYRQALLGGLWVRRWAWETTRPIRSWGDADNGLHWGHIAQQRVAAGGRWEDVYQYVLDRPQEAARHNSRLWGLDYPPLRLYVMWRWARWADARFAHDARYIQSGRTWQPQYEFTAPMLMLNTLAEWIAALAAFALVWVWARRKPPPSQPKTPRDSASEQSPPTHDVPARREPDVSASRDAQAIGQDPVRWRDRFRAHPLFTPYRGMLVAWIAALLVWFNPAVIVDGYCWPQWDSWVLPFVMLAMLCATLARPRRMPPTLIRRGWLRSLATTASRAILGLADGWLWAGLLLGVGGMLKGQTLFIAPLFVLWPLFRGRWGDALRVVIGLALAVGVILWPWLVDQPMARTWIVCIALAAALAVASAMMRSASPSRSALRLGLIAAALGLALWPYALAAHRPLAPFALIIGAALAVAAWRMTADLALIGAAAIIAIGLWACAPVLGGSVAPLRVGVEYGAEKYQELATRQVDNLPALLGGSNIGGYYNWGLKEPLNVDFTPDVTRVNAALARWHVWPFTSAHFSGAIGSIYTSSTGALARQGDWPLTLKQFLRCLCCALLVLCAYGAARQSRRNDPRLLIALAAPWVIFFAIMPQMHQRYLLWGGAITAVSVAVDWGLLLLSIFISFVAAGIELDALLSSHKDWSPSLYALLEGSHPDLGWAILLAAGILLYFALRPRGA